MADQSQRGFLAYLGLAGVATAAAAPYDAPKIEAPESPGHFEHPAEYLAAMQAIGWLPRAMYHPLEDGTPWRMGVNENPMPGVSVNATWTKFHAIQMRVPAQRPSDFPAGDWWNAVWHHLYDLGLCEDVSPPSRRAPCA